MILKHSKRAKIKNYSKIEKFECRDVLSKHTHTDTFINVNIFQKNDLHFQVFFCHSLGIKKWMKRNCCTKTKWWWIWLLCVMNEFCSPCCCCCCYSYLFFMAEYSSSFIQTKKVMNEWMDGDHWWYSVATITAIIFPSNWRISKNSIQNTLFYMEIFFFFSLVWIVYQIDNVDVCFFQGKKVRENILA